MTDRFLSSSDLPVALPVRRGFWQRAWRSRSLVLGALLTLTVLAVAVLAWFWTPHPPAQMDVLRKLQPPGASHWLGTDVYGHDVASQLMVGAQSSILVGLIAVGIGLLGGVTLGLLAATCKGWVDELVMRLADVAFAFPALLLAILFTAVYGSGVGVSMLAIGMAGIPVFARISRASAQVLWTREFVLAARACGKGRWRITRDHILPNLAPLLLVQATVQFAIAILAEAALSYLGLGTQYPTPSWGRMLSEAQSLMFQAPLLAVYPGVAIALSVLGLNLLGDGLRDVLDPRG